MIFIINTSRWKNEISYAILKVAYAFIQSGPLNWMMEVKSGMSPVKGRTAPTQKNAS